MKPSLLIRAADGVKNFLNANVGAFERPFVAERHLVLRRTLEGMGEAIHVDVVPRQRESERFSRRDRQHELQVMVSVMRRLSGDELYEADALMALIDEIDRQLMDADLPGGLLAEFKWVRSELTLPFAADLLDTQNTFLSILTITYLTMEA